HVPEHPRAAAGVHRDAGHVRVDRGGGVVHRRDLEVVEGEARLVRAPARDRAAVRLDVVERPAERAPEAVELSIETGERGEAVLLRGAAAAEDVLDAL